MTLDITRIQALCFDIDGTLSDTDDLFVQRLARLLKPVSYVFKSIDLQKAARRLVMASETPGSWLMSISDRFGLDDELMLVANFITSHKPGPLIKEHLVIHGIVEMLEALQTRYPMSVVSARDQASSLNFLDMFNLRRFFPVVATAQTCPYTKPFADPLIWAAAQMGIPASSCLMIGDTVVDIRAGKSAGAQTVGVLCGFGTHNELRKAGADLILNHTAQLIDILG